MTTPVLSVQGLVKEFPIRGGLFGGRSGTVSAVRGVSFEIGAGRALGLVGESGSGKTTVGKSVMHFHTPTDGQVLFKGTDLTALPRREWRRIRRGMQFVFQDPYASLPSRMTIDRIIAEPLVIHGIGDAASRRQRVDELLDLVGLGASTCTRYPHEMSGGQRQRVGIARALALDPELLILDEPVSALDVSVQAQIVNLLISIQREVGVSYLFIAHDLAVVRHIAHEIAVMHLGQIIEQGETKAVLRQPVHPYTQALVSAVPLPDPKLRDRAGRIVLSGEPPNPADPPTGCAFRTRCWRAEEICAEQDPPLTLKEPFGHQAACHFAGATSGVGAPQQGRHVDSSSEIET